MRLNSKAALITGAGSGIGRITAQAFANQGAAVAVVDIDEKAGNETVRLLVDQGAGHTIFVQADVSKSGDCKK